MEGGDDGSFDAEWDVYFGQAYPFARAKVKEDNSGVSGDIMKTYSAVIERDPDTGLFVGFVPGFPGAHSQGATLDELNANLREVVAMLLEDGEPVLESEFVGVQTVAVA